MNQLDKHSLENFLQNMKGWISKPENKEVAKFRMKYDINEPRANMVNFYDKKRPLKVDNKIKDINADEWDSFMKMRVGEQVKFYPKTPTSTPVSTPSTSKRELIPSGRESLVKPDVVEEAKRLLKRKIGEFAKIKDKSILDKQELSNMINNLVDRENNKFDNKVDDFVENLVDNTVFDNVYEEMIEKKENALKESLGVEFDSGEQKDLHDEVKKDLDKVKEFIKMRVNYKIDPKQYDALIEKKKEQIRKKKEETEKKIKAAEEIKEVKKEPTIEAPPPIPPPAPSPSPELRLMDMKLKLAGYSIFTILIVAGLGALVFFILKYSDEIVTFGKRGMKNIRARLQ